MMSREALSRASAVLRAAGDGAAVEETFWGGGPRSREGKAGSQRFTSAVSTTSAYCSIGKAACEVSTAAVAAAAVQEGWLAGVASAVVALMSCVGALHRTSVSLGQLPIHHERTATLTDLGLLAAVSTMSATSGPVTQQIG